MKSRQRIARYVLLLSAFLMVLYGLVVLFQPNLFTDNLELYSGISMEELARSNKRLSNYIDMVIRLNGALNILIGTTGLIAVYQSFRKREKWILWIIVVTIIFGYLAPMTFDQITGVIRYPEIIEIIAFVCSFIAIVIIWPEFQKTKGKSKVL